MKVLKVAVLDFSGKLLLSSIEWGASGVGVCVCVCVCVWGGGGCFISVLKIHIFDELSSKSFN